MTEMILLDKSNKHFSKFMGLLKDQSEVKLVDLKKVIPRTSYYAVMLKKLLQVNQILGEINPKLYLAEPSFGAAGKSVFTCVKRCDLIEIESKHSFYVIRWKI